MSEKKSGRYGSELLDLRFFLILNLLTEEDQIVDLINWFYELNKYYFRFIVFFAPHNSL